MTQLTLIIPCFNEEKRLKVQEYIDYSKDNEIIFCFVNDGSNDNTDKIINEIILKTKNNFKITLNKNFGKA